ncbi:YibE/F family protein [Aminipila luticellarii]|uniref:YibE/F family protein n=1 Tax=Aminipila luticellarii TaxID=2507160 RepID=A0A410PYE1_9FIRM|nr:YibE/F family protein [Aminipila luticellarii]QAT43969.1 YibE/F family protein [Aminipila luticellarii]
MLKKFAAIITALLGSKGIYKKYLILNIIIIAILTVGVCFVFNDYSWYDTTIVQIQNVAASPVTESNRTKSNEKYFQQSMVGIIMNGEYQGKRIYLQNKSSSSGVLDDKYKSQNEVFVKLHLDHSSKKLTGSIIGFKRDKYMAVLLALFILLLINVTKMKGFFTLLSLCINIGGFIYAVHLNYAGHNVLILSEFLVLFFTFISLLLIGGFKKKTFVAILSTLISLCFTMLIFKLAMICTQDINYTYMEYITGQNYMADLFMSQVLIGGLGAIMDVAITETSAINELVVVNKEISIRELIQSGREVGFDIMGTMINILLFTYVCGIIPIVVLKMKNSIKLGTIIRMQMPMELYGFMIGGIGILLTIPISVFVSIVLFKKLRRSL